MAESKRPSLFGKFFKGRKGEKVTPKDLQEQEASVRKDPNNLRALHKLGDLYAKAEQPEKAIETYIQAAESYIERAFYQKAVAVFKQILKMKPSLLDVQKRLAEVYIELGRRSDALTQYQNLVRKYESSGKLPLAIEMLLEMLALDEENVSLRVKLAELYIATSEPNSAITEFEKALNTLANQENWSDYVKVGERLLFAAPEHLNALKTIARVYLDNGDVMKAMGKLQKAFQLERRDPETLEVLAVAFDRLEQPEKTISVLKELAEIYNDLGRFDYVRDVYQQVLERDPNDAFILKAIAELPNSQLVSDLPAAPSTPPPAIPTPPPAIPTPPPASTSEPSLSLSDEELERLLNEADVYIKYGLVPRVEEALNRIFAAYPEHSEARHLKVELLKMQERAEEAANELLQLAKESKDNTKTLSYLEQILELDDIPPILQEEAYQMTTRLRSTTGSPSAEISTHSSEVLSSAPPALESPTGEFNLGDEEAVEMASADDFNLVPFDDDEDIEIVSLDDLAAIESPSREMDASFVSQDDLFIVEEFSQELPQARAEDSQNALVISHEEQGADPFSQEPVEEYGSLEELHSIPFTDDSLVHEVQELELLDEDDELTQPPTMNRAMMAPVLDERTNPELKAAPGADFPPRTPPAPPAPSMFAPPQKTEPENDPFGQFLMRAKENEPIEEEEENFDKFEDFPVMLESEKSSEPISPTRSGISPELSDMEAAAARLEALIQAKEKAEKAEKGEAEEEEVRTDPMENVPAPFSVPSPTIPAPFTTPAPVTEEPTPSEPMNAIEAFDSVDDGNAFPAPFETTSEILEEETENSLGFITEDTNPSAERDAVLPPDSEVLESTPTEALLADPEDPFAQGADDDLDFGDFDGAFDDIQEVEIEDDNEFMLDPSDPHIEALEEAVFYLDQEEPQYAIELFDRILQQDPEHEIAKAGINLALELDKQLQVDSEQDDGFLFDLDTALGEITTTKRERDRVEGELRTFKEEAQKQFGEDGETMYELGVAYYGMELYEMAAETFQNCIHIQHREFDCYKMIGICSTAQGLKDQALTTYQSALQLPGITTDERLDVLYEMANVYEDVGNTSDALAYFEEVSMLNEDYRDVQLRIQTLRAG